MTKYFMFSNGEYSDYCVGGLYKTEKDVPEGAWIEFLANYYEAKQAQQKSAIIAYGERTGKGHNVRTSRWRGVDEVIISVAYNGQSGDYNAQSYAYSQSPEYAAFDKWDRENYPAEQFKKLYELEEIVYEECHEG